MIAIAVASVLSAATPAPLSRGAGPAPDPVDACRAAGLTRTRDRSGAAGVRRLADLPPGVLQRTVLRSIGGCEVIDAQVEGRRYFVPAGPGALLPLTPAGEPGRRR